MLDMGTGGQGCVKRDGGPGKGKKKGRGQKSPLFSHGEWLHWKPIWFLLKKRPIFSDVINDDGTALPVLLSSPLVG